MDAFIRSHRHSRIILQLGAMLLGWLSSTADDIRPITAPRPTLSVAAGEDEAITAALAALPVGGGVIKLGAGTFLIKHPIILERDDVELRGHGADTLLILAPQANCPVVIVGSPSTPTDRIVHRITVRDLLIDGDRDEQNFECYGGPCNAGNSKVLRNNGITIRGAEEVLIENVVTRRARSGGVVLEKRCRKIQITGLDSYENEFDGLAAYETENSDFTQLNLHHNRSAGFSFDWRFNHNRITDSIAADNGSQGIFMRDSMGNDFERVQLQANGEQGVFMAETRSIPGTACRYNKFRMVTITGNKAHGIRVNDASCNPNTLENSVVNANGAEDISLADFGQLEIIQSGVALVSQ